VIPLPGLRVDRLADGAEQTQRIVPVGERTQPNAPLDPNYRPETTQKLDAAKPAEADAPFDPEATQRMDDSNWRLQEAKRILQGIPQK